MVGGVKRDSTAGRVWSPPVLAGDARRETQTHACLYVRMYVCMYKNQNRVKVHSQMTNAVFQPYRKLLMLFTTIT